MRRQPNLVAKGQNNATKKFDGKSYVSGIFTSADSSHSTSHNYYLEKGKNVVTIALRNEVVHKFKNPPMEINSPKNFLDEGSIKPFNTQYYPVYALFDDDPEPVQIMLKIDSNGCMTFTSRLGAPFKVTILPFVVQYM